jgi:fucose 4-O-acetylase-like acetyltransferase
MIFVFGAVFGAGWPKYQALNRKSKLFFAAISWVVFGIFFVSENSSDFGLPHLNLGLSFVKVPLLSGGEALRYLSLILGILLTTDLFWHRIAKQRAAGFIQDLGRKSLPVYVLHLWVVQAAGAIAVSLWWICRWQILFAPICIGLLWGFANLFDMKIALPRPRKPVWALPRISRQSVASAAQ